MSLIMLLIGFGMVQMYPSVKEISGFQELLADPAYRALLGPIILDMTSLEGYLTVEVFLFLWIFIAPFVLLLSANAVATEIEDKTIDILLSHPVKRYSLVLGKFLSILLYLTIIMAVTWLGLIWGIQYIGESINQARLFYAILGAYSLFIVMTSYSFFFSCIYDDSRKALAASFGVLFGTYFINTLANIVEALEPLKYFSPFNYYNPGEILFEGVFNTQNFLTLIIFSIATMLVSTYWFQRKDIYVT
jgi:ABC-2 type transport system permease protein